MSAARRHAESIATSSFLSKLPLIGVEEDTVERLGPQDLIPILQDAGIEFVLAGAHGIGGWMREPRATQDVDFIVKMRDKRKAADAILSRHPDWRIEKFPDVWRLKQGEVCMVDLMLTRAPLMKRVFTEAVSIRLGKRTARIPKLEAALALKFAAMTGYYRRLQKKHLDAHDFIQMVEANKEINARLLAELGELVYAGGGAEIVKYVEDARAGRKLEI
jgi:hypothetical protein